MGLISALVDNQNQMVTWRHELHQYPELTFRQRKTAQKIAGLLKKFGIDEVIEDFGTGNVLGVIHNGNGPAIGLVAEIDPQLLQENNPALPYVSRTSGCMHSLGHDGETAMLLGAAQYLSRQRTFLGTIVFIFSAGYGGTVSTQTMIEDGLFEQYPVDAVYGLYSCPQLPIGQIAIDSGASLASVTELLVKIIGKSGHAAFPNRANNPIFAASEIVDSLNNLTLHAIGPVDPLVLAVTSINGGNSFQYIPGEVELKASIRSLSVENTESLPEKIDQIITALAEVYNVKTVISFRRVCPVMVNSIDLVPLAREVAIETLGRNNVQMVQPKMMVGTDFSFLLQEKPGLCIAIGNGRGAEIFESNYDFCDEVLSIGASFWVNLVKAFCHL